MSKQVMVKKSSEPDRGGRLSGMKVQTVQRPTGFMMNQLYRDPNNELKLVALKTEDGTQYTFNTSAGLNHLKEAKRFVVNNKEMEALAKECDEVNVSEKLINLEKFASHTKKQQFFIRNVFASPYRYYVFADDFFDVVAALSAQGAVFDKAKLREIRRSVRNDGDKLGIISEKDLEQYLDDLNIERSRIVVIFDFVGMFARDYVFQHSGIVSTVAPDGNQVMNPLDVVLNLFQNFICGHAWKTNHCSDNGSCMDNYKRAVLKAMVDFKELSTKYFVPLSCVQEESKKLKAYQCKKPHSHPDQDHLFSTANHTDEISFETYAKVARSFGIPVFASFLWLEHESNLPIPVWVARTLLIAGWLYEFNMDQALKESIGLQMFYSLPNYGVRSPFCTFIDKVTTPEKFGQPRMILGESLPKANDTVQSSMSKLEKQLKRNAELKIRKEKKKGGCVRSNSNSESSAARKKQMESVIVYQEPLDVVELDNYYYGRNDGRAAYENDLAKFNQATNGSEHMPLETSCAILQEWFNLNSNTSSSPKESTSNSVAEATPQGTSDAVTDSDLAVLAALDTLEVQSHPLEEVHTAEASEPVDMHTMETESISVTHSARSVANDQMVDHGAETSSSQLLPFTGTSVADASVNRDLENVDDVFDEMEQDVLDTSLDIVSSETMNSEKTVTVASPLYRNWKSMNDINFSISLKHCGNPEKPKTFKTSEENWQEKYDLLEREVVELRAKLAEQDEVKERKQKLEQERSSLLATIANLEKQAKEVQESKVKLGNENHRLNNIKSQLSKSEDKAIRKYKDLESQLSKMSHKQGYTGCAEVENLKKLLEAEKMKNQKLEEEVGHKDEIIQTKSLQLDCMKTQCDNFKDEATIQKQLFEKEQEITKNLQIEVLQNEEKLQKSLMFERLYEEERQKNKRLEIDADRMEKLDHAHQIYGRNLQTRMNEMLHASSHSQVHGNTIARLESMESDLADMSSHFEVMNKNQLNKLERLCAGMKGGLQQSQHDAITRLAHDQGAIKEMFRAQQVAANNGNSQIEPKSPEATRDFWGSQQVEMLMEEIREVVVRNIAPSLSRHIPGPSNQ